MARVSAWDEKRDGRIVPPPTLPAINLADIDIEREAKEAAGRVAERRAILPQQVRQLRHVGRDPPRLIAAD